MLGSRIQSSGAITLHLMPLLHGNILSFLSDLEAKGRDFSSSSIRKLSPGGVQLPDLYRLKS